MTRIGTLASGRGSNFNALVDAWKKGSIPGAEFVVLISDKPGTGALDVARGFGVETVTLSPKDFPSREAQEEAVIAALRDRKVDLVCLAGYMRILGPKFIGAFPGRILNIHPALLPSFPGLHGQKQAVEYGVKVSGATVHFVDAGCDTGPVIIQAAIPVLDDDSEETLAARILKEEHRIYPEAVRLFCRGRLKVSGRHVRITPE